MKWSAKFKACWWILRGRMTGYRIDWESGLGMTATVTFIPKTGKP